MLQLEKGNKQLGEILPPVYVDFYQRGLAASCGRLREKEAKVGIGKANSDCSFQVFGCVVGGKKSLGSIYGHSQMAKRQRQRNASCSLIEQGWL